MHQLVGNIKKLRELRNLTQKYMADELSMTQANYSKLEAGEIDIPYSRIIQIAKLLKSNIEDLVSHDEKRVFNTYFDKVEVAQTTNTGNIVGNKVFIEDIKNIYESQLVSQQKQINKLHLLLENVLSKFK